MKHLISVIVLSLAVLLSGCSTMRRAFYNQTPVQITPASTNAVVVARTNAIPITVTNRVTPDLIEVVSTTNYVVHLATNYVVTEATWGTNLTVRPGVVAATTAAEGLPVPGAPIAASAVSLAIAAYASWVNRRNQSKADQVAGTLVDNFEHLRQTALKIPGYTPEIDRNVMNVVKAAQRDTGAKEAITRIVDTRA